MLANSAPDSFAIRAAVRQGDILLAVGAMSGGALFTTCCVIPVVIWCAHERHLIVGGMFARDALSYFVVRQLLLYRGFACADLLQIYVCFGSGHK